MQNIISSLIFKFKKSSVTPYYRYFPTKPAIKRPATINNKSKRIQSARIKIERYLAIPLGALNARILPTTIPRIPSAQWMWGRKHNVNNRMINDTIPKYFLMSPPFSFLPLNQKEILTYNLLYILKILKYRVPYFLRCMVLYSKFSIHLLQGLVFYQQKHLQ